MECVQLPLLPCMKSPGLTAGQECAEGTGSIDLDLGIFGDPNRAFKISEVFKGTSSTPPVSSYG